MQLAPKLPLQTASQGVMPQAVLLFLYSKAGHFINWRWPNVTRVAALPC
jgi:hypothetical protein